MPELWRACSRPWGSRLCSFGCGGPPEVEISLVESHYRYRAVALVLALRDRCQRYESMLVDTHLTHGGHTRYFSITRTSNWWEVVEKEDGDVVSSRCRRDWHYV